MHVGVGVYQMRRQCCNDLIATVGLRCSEAQKPFGGTGSRTHEGWCEEEKGAISEH